MLFLYLFVHNRDLLTLLLCLNKHSYIYITYHNVKNNI